MNYEKHRTVLVHILRDCYADSELTANLGFKGGTAAMLLYGLPRFSVDLDFDLLGEMSAERVRQKMRDIASRYGTVSDSGIYRQCIRNVLSYASGEPRVKLEVNQKNYGSRYEQHTLLGIALPVMVREDMFAHKLSAMLERVGKTSRDIYDVRWFAQQRWPINAGMVEQRTGLSFERALGKAVTAVKKIPPSHILDGLGDLLNQRQKDSARATLRDDTVFLLEAMRLEHRGLAHHTKRTTKKYPNG